MPAKLPSRPKPTTPSPERRAAPAWGLPYRNALLRCTGANLGRVATWPGLDFCLQAPGRCRATGGAGRWRKAPEPPLAARVTYAKVALLIPELEASQTRFHLHVRVSVSVGVRQVVGMSKRILVVEDQPDNRQIIRDMLAPTDYEIIEVEDGEQALAAIAKQRPDLILMDIQLPIMDGYTATSRIKSDPALRSIPIIAVTSYALSGEEKKARAAGCDDYVPKPFSPRQLLAKIKQYLS